MTGIDKLIFNELMCANAVHLPGLGSLEPVRTGAKQTDSGKIAPPATEIVFHPDSEQGRSVIDMLRDFGLETHKAEEIYSQWLVDSKETYDLNIGGVGKIKDGVFFPEDEFHHALNPHHEVYVDMKPARKNNALPWIILAVVLFLAGVAFAVWKSGMFDSWNGTVFPETEVLTEEEIDDVMAQEEDKKSFEAVNIAEAALTPELNAPKTDNRSINKSEAVRGRYYIVAGVFTVESNADNYIKTYKNAYPDVTPEKIPFEGKTMVTIYSTDDSRDAETMAARYRHRHYNTDLWVYHSK